MGRVLNPNMLIESAESMNNAGRAYIDSMYEVKPAMEAILNDSELAGQTATAIKRRAEAHLILLEHFQITEAMNTSELSKLKSALSNIKTEIDEDEIRATMEDEQRDIAYFRNQIDWLRKQDREYSFGGLFNYYQYNLDSSHNIINQCKEKLRELNKFDSMSQSYFVNVIDNYKMQKQAIRDMMQADIKGDYSNVDYSNISAIESRVKSFLSDKNKVDELLFDGKKLRKESLKLFTDTPRDKMSGIQRALYNRVIEFVLSDDCTADDLTSVVDAYYKEAKEKRIGVSKVEVRVTKETFHEFVEDLEDGLYTLTMDGESNNNMVSRVALFSEISKVRNIHSIGSVEIEELSSIGHLNDKKKIQQYSIPISIYGTEDDWGTYERGRYIQKQRAFTVDDSIVVRTDGHGTDGADTFKSQTLTKQIRESKIKTDDFIEMGIGITQDLTGISIPILPTILEYAEKKNKEEKMTILLGNLYESEFAKLTDSYITTVNDRAVLRNGPNTKAIIKYLEEKGYDMSGDRASFIESFVKLAKDSDKSTSSEINRFLSIELDKRGQKWIN